VGGSVEHIAHKNGVKNDEHQGYTEDNNRKKNRPVQRLAENLKSQVGFVNNFSEHGTTSSHVLSAFRHCRRRFTNEDGNKRQLQCWINLVSG